jgi:hypothetical protein
VSVPFQQLVEHGERLFTSAFNRLDGQGRGSAAMLRTAGPEAHSCVSCHNRPTVGGGGDFPTNVFMMAQGVTGKTAETVNPELSNERSTLSLYGSGPIEILAQ